MNVTIPDNKLDIKAKIVYGSIIFICVLSIILVVWAQFFDGKIVTTVGNLKGKSDQGYEELKTEFNKLFTNNLQKYDETYKNKRIDSSKELIYTGYTNSESEEDHYSLDVNIPYINIKGDTIEKYNKEIKNVFENKAEEILKNKSKFTLYTVQYSAYIQDGVLSIVIRASIKEGTNAQRVLVKTYNYSLEENKEVDLNYLLNLEKVEEKYVQSKIDEEIQSQHKKAEDLKAMGNPIFERDLEDEMYKVENIDTFYFHDGSIYIIFPYGNKKFTSEVDIAII